MRKFKDIIYFLTISILFYSGIAQNKTEKIPTDTIFFKVEENYFTKGKFKQDQYYIKDALKDKGSSEVLFFKIIEVNYDIVTEKICNLREYIRTSDYYDNERKVNRLDDFGLASHLQHYIIYLVDENHSPAKYLKVYPMTEIE